MSSTVCQGASVTCEFAHIIYLKWLAYIHFKMQVKYVFQQQKKKKIGALNKGLQQQF